MRPTSIGQLAQSLSLSLSLLIHSSSVRRRNDRTSDHARSPLMSERMPLSLTASRVGILLTLCVSVECGGDSVFGPAATNLSPFFAAITYTHTCNKKSLLFFSFFFFVSFSLILFLFMMMMISTPPFFLSDWTL